MATLRVFCAVVNGILNINYLNVKFNALNMKQAINMFKGRHCVYKCHWCVWGGGGGGTNAGNKPS